MESVLLNQGNLDSTEFKTHLPMSKVQQQRLHSDGPDGARLGQQWRSSRHALEDTENIMQKCKVK